jgi:carbon storage regulator
MLVLTRKPGEQVLIGDDIVITIIENRGDGVRIGIDAPRGIAIQRAEIVQAVTEVNVEATKAAPDAEERLKAALGIVAQSTGAEATGAPSPSAPDATKPGPSK